MKFEGLKSILFYRLNLKRLTRERCYLCVVVDFISCSGDFINVLGQPMYLHIDIRVLIFLFVT